MGINDLFDGSMKRIDQFAFALAEPQLQEKMQESRPGSEDKGKNVERFQLQQRWV